jgi:hypothetical protein
MTVIGPDAATGLGTTAAGGATTIMTAVSADMTKVFVW